MVAVERRNRETLIPLIQRFIAPGTTIISDCWKPYDILSEMDFIHFRVNHSIEFKNINGDHTNKIEGHWRHAKNSLPSYGVRKHLFSSHLAEFIWRYQNKGKCLFQAFISDVSKVYPPNSVYTYKGKWLNGITYVFCGLNQCVLLSVIKC